MAHRQKELRAIAVVARRQMERFARKYDDIGFPKDLGCYCAIASYFLVELAVIFGYEAEIAEGAAFDKSVKKRRLVAEDVNHCWVVVGKQIYDITATQFATNRLPLPSVHCTKVKDPNYLPFQQGPKVVEAFRKDWPKQQSPLTWKKQLRPYLNAALEELQ